MEKTRLLHLVGIDDTDMVHIAYLSPKAKNVVYDLSGNVDLAPLVDEQEFELFLLVVGGMARDDVVVPPVKLILNAICDPDTNSRALTVAEALVDQLGVPVINDPRLVRRMTRDALPRMLAGDPEVRVPKTLRVRPSGRTDVAAIIERGEVVPPFLVREAGTHGGTDLTLVESAAHLDALDRFALDGRELYLTEFVDFRSPDGLYRKYRVLLIDGAPHPRHMVVAKTWNIHMADRDEVMPGSDYEHEERAFLASFCEDRRPVLERIAARMGPDFLGVDFALDDDGRIVVFESNCCFRALLPPGVQSRVSYHRDADARLRRAFRDLIRSRIR